MGDQSGHIGSCTKYKYAPCKAELLNLPAQRFRQRVVFGRSGNSEADVGVTPGHLLRDTDEGREIFLRRDAPAAQHNGRRSVQIQLFAQRRGRLLRTRIDVPYVDAIVKRADLRGWQPL